MHTAAFIAFGALAITHVTYRTLGHHGELRKFIESMPTVGVKKDEWSTWPRARLRAVKKTEQYMSEGYQKYLKNDTPFIMPTVRRGSVLILPPSQFKAVYSKPDQQLNSRGPSTEAISVKYIIRDMAVLPSNFEIDIIAKHVTKKLDSLTADLHQAIALASDKQWGLDKDWRAVRVWNISTRLVNDGFNRVLYGPELAHNKVFCEHVDYCSSQAAALGFFIAIFPNFLKPLIGPLISWRANSHCDAAIEICAPVVEKRLSMYMAKKKDPSLIWEPPVDIMQWLIEESDAVDPQHLNSRRIAHRLIMINFNISPAAFSFPLILANVTGGPDARTTWDTLQNEANTVLGNPGTWWNKEKISRLVLHDSVIRESLRYSDSQIHGLPREVSAPTGLTLPDGTRIPKGMRIEVALHHIQHDDDHYANGSTFMPFRFQDGTSQSRSAVTIDETFLGFGYGRTGCPGRVIASHFLKVMLAYLVMNYDVEFKEAIPPMMEIMGLRAADMKNEMRIRRR